MFAASTVRPEARLFDLLARPFAWVASMEKLCAARKSKFEVPDS
jgi:hypothetical protein